MITVDELRALDGHAQYMGLGVIKYAFRKNRAYHFYSNKILSIVDDIHEHKFGFTSTVIKGELKNYIYEIDGTDPNSTLQVERGVCGRDTIRTLVQSNINLVESCTFTTRPGQSYHIEYTTLHKIECLTPKVITLLTKELPLSQLDPQFITDATKQAVCAFSQPKSDAECWELIEYTLSDDDETI